MCAKPGPRKGNTLSAIMCTFLFLKILIFRCPPPASTKFTLDTGNYNTHLVST